MLTEHHHFMLHALRLAGAQLGRVWPNPAVGAVVVHAGAMVGIGATANGGRPHAETLALAMAGEKARGATLYVSLEPCSHTGKTPPCTDAIISAGITRVVVGCSDADPRVSGIATLQAAGIEVITGICETEARTLNAGFFKRIEKNRPLIALKIATTEDGYMALPASQWVTNEAARSFGQYVRSRFDAIATGTHTAIKDNPALTCRLSGMEKYSPQRVVLGRTPLPETLTLAAGDVWKISEHNLPQTLDTLAEKGITRLLVEAGPTLSAAFLNARLVDEIYWFKAPTTLGAGFPALPRLELGLLKPYTQTSTRNFGDNTLSCLQA
jgi:diaminohydroxyphosphoribosylaminopyrimidine deaminase / 5-amino-6-(5-phosphoribosylamino)uracil reductase